MTSVDAKIRLPDEILDALHGTGLPWEARAGGKHIKIYVGGRMATVCSYGTKKAGGPQGHLNQIKNIERTARELTQATQNAVKGE